MRANVCAFGDRYRRSINGTATLPTAKSCALNGKPIYVQTSASRVEHGLGFATVPEPNSGQVPGLSYMRRYTTRSIIGSVR